MDEFISPIWETVFTVATPIVVVAAILWPWLGSQIIVSSERRKVNKSRRSASVGQFAVKTMIVAAAVVVSTWIMLDVLDAFADWRMQQLEQMLRANTSLGGRPP
jgi:type III secretory pathway component EscS